MDVVKVLLDNGKLRLFINGEEETWEKSLVDNSNSNSTILDKIETQKKIDDVASDNVANVQDDLANVQDDVANVQDDVPSDNQANKQDDVASDNVANGQDGVTSDNVANGQDDAKNVDSNNVANGQDDAKDVDSNNVANVHDDDDDDKDVDSNNVANGQEDDSNKEIITIGIKNGESIAIDITDFFPIEKTDANNDSKKIKKKKKDSKQERQKEESFVNENADPDKSNVLILSNKNPSGKVGPKAESSYKEVKNPVAVTSKNTQADLDSVETAQKKKSNSKRRKNKRKQLASAEPKLQTNINTPIEDLEDERINYSRQYLQTILNVMSREGQAFGPGSCQIFEGDCVEIPPVAKGAPAIVKIEKIASLPALSKPFIMKTMCQYLNESTMLIEKIIDVLGLTKSLELYEKTKIVQEHGGLDVKNGSRKRTPGGVFFTIMREDSTIEKGKVDAILNDTNWRKEEAKQRRAKTNAEMKEKLEKGGYL